tara:strand:- start:6049 stop:7374 length:1326 start_codon:yes stop_codon:yes gene_type:complete
MKLILKSLLLLFVFIVSNNLFAQIGINTATPDASSALHIFSENKGFLMPRLDDAARDAIIEPANGLMIFNTSSNDSQLNIGLDGGLPNWKSVTTPEYPTLTEITKSTEATNSSTVDTVMDGMTLSVAPGTYTALFNAQLIAATFVDQTFGSDQGVIDLDILYDQIDNYSDGGTPEFTHSATFGSTNGETLQPGMYSVAGASSVSGTLILDGGTATNNPVFIIKVTGAITTVANTNVILTGNAKPENIFWLSGAAISTGASTKIKGTMIAGGLTAGAISLGADTTLVGRAFTKQGAISIGANTVISSPTFDSPFATGTLSTFAMFSAGGAVSDVVSSYTKGDAGTASGELTINGTHLGSVYPPGSLGESFVNVNTTTYSFYQNNILVANSTRTIKLNSSIVNLQATIIVDEADTFPTEIRWRVKDGDATLSNRTFSMIRATY